MRSVGITVLKKTFTVRCPTEHWASFIEVLWEPPFGSIGEAEDVLIEISRSGPKWLLVYGDHRYTSSDPWVIASAIRNFVSSQSLHLVDGVVPLHAATARLGETVLLLAGASGTGKTTLLLDMIDAGWTPAGDDLAVVSPDGRTISAFPKPVFVRDPVRWAGFRERWDLPAWVPEPSSAGLLAPTAVGMVAGSFTPSGLLFPRFDLATEPRFEQLRPAQAAAMCSANCQTPGGATPADVAVFVNLCRRIPAARLNYPSSRDAMALVEGFLADFAG